MPLCEYHRLALVDHSWGAVLEHEKRYTWPQGDRLGDAVDFPVVSESENKTRADTGYNSLRNLTRIKAYQMIARRLS